MALNSDARTEVEGMRWVLTRRAATAVIIVAIMVLATLRYSTYMTQTQKEERNKMAREKAEKGEGATFEFGHDGDPKTANLTEPISQTRDGTVLASQGTAEGYVSLG